MMSVVIPNHLESKIHEVISDVEILFPDCQIIVAVDRYSRGKGWAVREALSQATGEIVCFIDGDGDIHPSMINRLLPLLNDYDIVVGKKEIIGMPSRKLLTLLSRLYIRMFFGIPVDSQTGIKLFRGYALPVWKSNSFAFDIEILSKAKKAGFSMTEVTVEAKIVKRMRLKSIISALKESIKTWLELRSQ